jgi:hypothetical protein
MPTSISRAWVQEGEGPLLKRWQEAGDKLAKLGGSFVSPCSEIAVNEMNATIRHLERQKAAAAAGFVDERVLAAKHEFETVVHRYHLTRNAIVEDQRQLRSFRDDVVYGLLFDMREALQEPPATQDLLDAQYGGHRESSDLYHLRKPAFATVAEYRAAIAWASDQCFALETKRASVNAVLRFPAEEINSRLHRIAVALLRHINALEHEAVRNATLLQRLHTQTTAALSKRLDQIEAQITNLAKVARYVRQTKKELKHAK